MSHPLLCCLFRSFFYVYLQLFVSLWTCPSCSCVYGHVPTANSLEDFSHWFFGINRDRSKNKIGSYQSKSFLHEPFTFTKQNYEDDLPSETIAALNHGIQQRHLSFPFNLKNTTPSCNSKSYSSCQ